MEETIEMTEKEIATLIKEMFVFKTALRNGKISVLKDILETMLLHYANILARMGDWDEAFDTLRLYTEFRMCDLTDDQLMKVAIEINKGINEGIEHTCDQLIFDN